MTDEQKKALQSQLWNIANELRGKMNADEFRDYILGFIFYKYLSEKMHMFAISELKEDGIDYFELEEETDEGREILEAIGEAAVESLGYFLKPSELFSALAKRCKGKQEEVDEDGYEEEHAKKGSQAFILGDLTKVLANIENSTRGTESEEDFIELFEDLDLTSSKLGKSEEEKNTLIAKIFRHLNKIDFELDKADSDILGDAYEYLIGKFASGAGKTAGEFYTPQEVSTILAKLVTTGKDRLKTVYDPTCGSGSLLLRVAKEVEVSEFYGQELNRTTFNLARMNMLLHDIHYRKFSLVQEDTLKKPQHMDRKFEAVVANPPFSAKWDASKRRESDERFSQYGKLAPASKADFAFIQHMLHHLDDNGQMAVVVPHGVLFRGGAEGAIRRYLIENETTNWLDAVIGLPANIFFGTSIPTCILVFKKCREHPNNILFIDASAHFEKAKNQNFLRADDIDRIIETYRERKVKDKFSYRAKIAEIAENDFNLNIPRYVDTFEEEEPVDLKAVVNELRQLESDMGAVDKTISGFCKELGIEAPV